MKFKIISLALILFMAVLSFGCSTLIKENYSLFENDPVSISIQYPSTWEKKENNNSYVLFMALSPLENEEDDFRENVNVVTEPAIGFNLETYYEANLSSMTKGLKDFKILSRGTKIINNNPGKWLIYSHKYNELPLKVKAYIFHLGNNGIVFTGTANPASFKKYEATFDEIISSFKLK